MYDIQALWTAAHLKLQICSSLPTTASIESSSKRVRTRDDFTGFVGMDVRDPPIDCAALAAAMGVRALRVTEADAVGTALREALAHDGPTLLDVILDDGM